MLRFLTEEDAQAIAALQAASQGGGDTSVLAGMKYVAFDKEVSLGSSGSSFTVDFSNGQKQAITLSDNCTITTSFPGVGNYQLKVIQGSGTARTVTWAGSPRYVGGASEPALATGSGAETIVSIYWDGTNRYIGGAKVGQ